MAHKSRGFLAASMIVFAAVSFLAEPAPAAKNRKGKPGEVDYAAATAGKSGAEAARALLALAEAQVEDDGTWERLAIARVYAAAGDTTKAQELVDQVLAGKNDASDWVRIARVWIAANDWAKAKPWYDKVVAAEKGDEDWLAEAAGYYLVNGDAETAARLFAQSFDEDPDNLYNTLRAALAQVGKAPNP